MADKTEKATPKKKEESRQKGQVAKSQDLSGAAVMLAGLAVVVVTGPAIATGLADLMESTLRGAANPKLLEGPGMGIVLRDAGGVLAKAVLPIFGACAVAALVVVAAQVQLKFTPKAIKPDLKKLNPISGAKNVFGMNALVELVKNIAKVSAVGAVVYVVLKPFTDEMPTLVGMEPVAMGSVLVDHIWQIARAAGVAYLVIGIFDYVWQKYRMDKSMKMDKQEVKDEYKQAELPAEVKQQMRRRAMMAARARMMADVPDADVVVTNPTHYAVALKYSPDQAAPEVVAKGMDLVAFKIREIAKEHGVAVVPDPPLARALHASVEIGDHIPEELYEAVAQVLAFVYRTASERRRAAA